MPDVTATVFEARPETAEATTLRLDLGGAAFPYRPGQYIVLDPRQFEELGPAIRKREAERGRPEGSGYFALSSDGLTPGVLEITVKAKRGAEGGSPLAPFLAREVRGGRRIAFSGPKGEYCLPVEPPAGITGYLHLCAGSGVAPNRGMIRHALGRGWPQKHLLVLQDRTEEDVLFGAEWEDLGRRHGERFRLVKVFSRGPAGRPVTAGFLRGELDGFLRSGSSVALVCGPNAPRGGEPGFVDRWCGDREGSRAGGLLPLGITPDRILTARG